MVQANFTSVLDTPSSAVERPKPLPVGTWIGTIAGLPKIDKSSKKQTEYSEYLLKNLQPQEDVDPDAVEAFGNLSERTVRVTYYHTPDALYRLKEFLDHLDIPAEDDGEEMTIRERMQMVPNRQVKFTIKHTASDDGSSVYANVSGTAKVE